MFWHKELWLPEYSIGNQVLDAQHKKLLWLCHAAAYYLGNHKDDESERYKDLLHDLETFAREHLSTEEGILERIRYPALAEHRSEHQAFLARLSSFLQDVQLGQVHSEELLAWLNGWWLDHTLGTDKQYFSFISKDS